MSEKTKLRLYLWSSQYCFMVKKVKKKDKKRLDGFHHKCLRKIVGVKYQDGLKNVDIRKRTKQKKIAEITCKRRLQWYGHVAGMAISRPPEFGLDWIPKMD